MRALIAIGGITDETYARSTMRAHQLGDIYRSRYSRIIEARTEQYFDSFDHIGLLSPLWDRYGDIPKAYLNPARMAAARQEVVDKVQELRSGCYQVDVLAHSLGTQILAGARVRCGRVVMAGSPLTFSRPVGRWLARSELRHWRVGPYREGLRCKELLYMYSPLDLVCNEPIEEELARRYTASYRAVSTGTGHSFVGYLDTLYRLEEEIQCNPLTSW